MPNNLKKDKIYKFYSLLKNSIFHKDIYCVVENVEWVIKNVGDNISGELNKMGLRAGITYTQKGIYNSLVHFCSINVFYPARFKVNIPDKSNKVVVTYFHVIPGDERLKDLKDINRFVDMWHTASNITKQRLVEFGLPAQKIAVIPLGVNLNVFKPFPLEDKIRLREKLGIRKDHIVIGSFQKDGVGWGNGFEPKLIKGPDVFCEVAKRLAKKYPVFVLLTGPARGFVKRQLDASRIPYQHVYTRYSELPKFYNMLDLYLVTSRVEGLPKSILECMATSTPFVTTRVGIAPDVVTDTVNGFICEIGDIAGIIARARTLIEDKGARDSMGEAMQKTIKDYAWGKVIQKYVALYLKLKAC